MTQRPFQRGNPDGFRLQFGGMNTVMPPDQMPPNKYPYAQNVRSYVRQRVGPRAAQDDAVVVAAGSVHSICRLNDSTPAGPASGYVLVVGADANLFLSSSPAARVPLPPSPPIVIPPSNIPFHITPSLIQFGTIPANVTATMSVTITNAAPVPTDIGTWDSVLLTNSTFTLSGVPQLPLHLGGGQSVTFQISINQPAGNYVATLKITTSGTNVGFTEWNISVGATVQAPPATGSINVAPPSVNFGNQVVGVTSPVQTIHIINNLAGGVSLNLSAPVISNPDFSFQNPPTWPVSVPNNVSTPNAGLALQMVVTPSIVGTETATLTLNTDSAAFPQLVIPLTVIGINPPPPTTPPGGGGGGPIVFSGNPLSMIPFRPNASPQPWLYIGDSVSMEKIRSDGTIYRVGVAEPQTAPQTKIIPASDVISTVGPITVTYWGDSPHTGPVGNYIWKHASDTTGSGPVRATTPAAGATTGNSIIFDVPAFAGLPLPNAFASKDSPMLWFQYETYNGLVSTTGDGTQVVWNSGDQFGGLVAGDQIIIGGISYTIAPSPTPTNTTLNITVSAGIQDNINYSAAIVGGPTDVFQPALESEGFADFNFVLTGTLYVPFAGDYTFYWQSKDESLFGIGNSGLGLATWGPPSQYPGAQWASSGQTVTAINGYPLLPKTITVQSGSTGGQYNNGGSYVGGSVAAGYSGVVVNFSQPGNYPFEIDYDYWYHSGRILHMEVTGPGQAPATDLPPLPLDVITNASYRYTYRSSATGATSNPSPESPQQNFSVLSTEVIPILSVDPQVDKIDVYRMDSGLLSFTYVGTIPNLAPASFNDKLLDTDVSGNPLLQFDNFEPFPSIDLPRAGTANVLAGGILQAMTGDAFNVRWLPGTIILVGTTAFTLNTRPATGTQLTCSNVDVIQGVEQVVYPDPATGISWAIQEPILAAQRLPYLWGPTDNVAFFFACGDPLRPGTLYWSKGNQPDSAPDTNQQDVTSPSEPLMNGCITNGLGMVFSTERAWIIIPNFFNAQATVEGTVGSTWTLQETVSNRGLFLPWCLCVDGGGNVYFRAKDGIYVSPSGQGSQSITDPDLFNLFPHEGVERKLTPITIGVAPNAYTVYPPDDSQPAFQNLHFANGYLYYDYRDASSIPRTLVFDVAAGGWVVDVYADPVRSHVLEEGIVNGTLVGTESGNVRPLNGVGAEVAIAKLLMPSFDAGDVRANKQWGDLYVEAEAGSVK